MKTTTSAVIRFITFCLLSLALAACSGEKLATIPAGSTVLILGDSLSYGTGAAEGEDYPTLLAQRTGWNIINAGVPGDTSAQGLERLPSLLEAHQPALLVVELGGNDFLRNIDINQTEANLRAIISAAQLKRVQALLVAIPDYQPVRAALGVLSDHPIYAKLAEETHVPLVEEVFTDVLSNNSLKADYVHPNAEGYKIVEAHLGAVLNELGLFKLE
jgi:acyl-CoA thioesterase I